MTKTKTIVLDPGHGDTRGMPGFDPGACFGQRCEAEAALEAALTLKALLTERGYRVLLTRDGTRGAKPDLAQRLKFAAQNGADAFVSMHYDMTFPSPGRHRRGVYHAPGTASLKLAKALTGALGKSAWIAPSSSSRFGGLYIDAFPDARPSVMLELDSIQFAPPTGPLGKLGRLAMLEPIADILSSQI